MSGSNEFFYLDENQKKHDAELHDPILENPAAEAAGVAQTIADLRAQGWTDEQLSRLFVL